MSLPVSAELLQSGLVSQYVNPYTVKSFTDTSCSVASGKFAATAVGLARLIEKIRLSDSDKKIHVLIVLGIKEPLAVTTQSQDSVTYLLEGSAISN